MSVVGNLLQQFGGVIGQALIPIPGVGAFLGQIGGKLAKDLIDGGTAQKTPQQTQGAQDPISIAAQAFLNGGIGSKAATGSEMQFAANIFPALMGK